MGISEDCVCFTDRTVWVQAPWSPAPWSAAGPVLSGQWEAAPGSRTPTSPPFAGVGFRRTKPCAHLGSSGCLPGPTGLWFSSCDKSPVPRHGNHDSEQGILHVQHWRFRRSLWHLVPRGFEFSGPCFNQSPILCPDLHECCSRNLSYLPLAQDK